MYTFTNTRSGPTTSTKATTTSTSTSPYVAQTEFSNTIDNIIKYLLANLDCKHAKQDAKFTKTVSEQDEKFDTQLD